MKENMFEKKKSFGKKRLFGVALSVGILGTVLVGCDAPQTSDEKQQAQQEQLLQEGSSQTGMPNVVNFRERKELKTILEKRDQANLITYVYTHNEMDGKWVYEGEAMGYPLPYSTEYTNPEKIADHYQGGYAVLPQADPNGLFSSQSTQADWILMIDPKTHDTDVQYVEPNMRVTGTKLPKQEIESWSLTPDY